MPQVNVTKIVELTARKGWSQARLANAAGIDVDTVGHIFAASKSGHPARRCLAGTAELLAEALGVETVDILCDETGRPLRGRSANVIGSWLVKSEGVLRKAQNGLAWRECELVHVEDDERARAKLYDLRDPPTREQSAIEACLKRHRLVCKRVGKHANIALNLDIIRDPADAKFWWVIDEWVSDTRLSDLFARGPMPGTQLAALMRTIADGLAALHAADVIRRDLNPRSILVTGDTAVLTDFELAKLPGALPTVAPNAKWREDVYRAPEVAGAAELDPNCDLYSWAMILAHAASGQAPESPGEARALLRGTAVPTRIVEFAGKCLAPPSSRPRSVQDLIAVLKRWK